MRVLLLPAIVLLGIPIICLLTQVIFTGTSHLVALGLGSKGSYSGLFCGFVFAVLPCIFFTPLLVIIGLLLPIIGALFFSLGFFGVIVWSVVLSILAVRENYLVSTGKAILILLPSLATLMVLLVLILVPAI
jgi:hypothetical protein